LYPGQTEHTGGIQQTAKPGTRELDPDGGAGSMDGTVQGTGVINNSSGSTGGKCVMNCNNDSEPYSFHPGGMTTCFGDGSVRMLQEDIAAQVFASLVTARAGDLAGSDY
jgi:prepilin-type processing-associated H-X9-DG protein